jgi:hypothetical protein
MKKVWESFLEKYIVDPHYLFSIILDCDMWCNTNMAHETFWNLTKINLNRYLGT